jgi:clathrin heavy chain
MVTVIESFKQAPMPPGSLSPILQYFGILLEKGELNHLESLELAHPVLHENDYVMFSNYFLSRP